GGASPRAGRPCVQCECRRSWPCPGLLTCCGIIVRSGSSCVDRHHAAAGHPFPKPGLCEPAPATTSALPESRPLMSRHALTHTAMERRRTPVECGDARDGYATA